LKDEVYNRCGEPENIELRTEIRGGRTSTGIKQSYGESRSYFPNNLQSSAVKEVTIEEWTYSINPQHSRQMLRFEHGKLIEIIDLPK
jgi:hypothetical protein